MGLVSGIQNTIGKGLNRLLGTNDAMKQQNQMQWDMWNAQNAYNTPAAQMQRLKDAGLNPMLVYNSGSHSFSAGSMSASGASGAGGSFASSLVSALFGRLTQRDKNELARQGLVLEKQRISQAGIRLNQDLQLGQAQIDQVKANALNALLQAERQDLENESYRKSIGTGFAWQKPGTADMFNTTIRGLKWLADPSLWGVQAPAVYDESLPAIGANARR